MASGTEPTDARSAAEQQPGRPAEGVRNGAPPPAAGARFDFGRVWVAVACLMLVATAALLYFGRPEAAFVTAALGVSAWFLNVRNGLKREHDLVKRGGRNWEPRGRAEDPEDEDSEDEDSEG